MASLADLNVRIGAQIQGLQRGLSNAEKALKRSGAKLSSIGQDLTSRISLPLIGVGTAAITAFSNFEKLEKGLGAIIGDAEKTAKELEALKEVAKNPGLGFAQAVQGSVRLQSVGFSAETSRRALAAFGNAIALVGGDASDLDGVSLALSQVASKGKISAEEINQLAERVPQIRAALKNAFGTAVSEDLQALNVSAAQFTEGVVSELEKLPAAANTIGNSINNLGQAATGLFVSIGRDLNKSLNIQGAIETVSSFLTSLADRFSNLSPSIKSAVAVFGLVALALPPLVAAFGTLQVALAAAFSPVTLFVGGMAALTAAFTFAYKESEQFRRIANGVGAALITLGRIVASQVISRFNFLKDTIVDVVTNGFQLLIEIGKLIAIPFRALIRFLTGDAVNGFKFFGESGSTILENFSGNVLGFVNGVRSVFSEFIKIVNEGVGSFIEGFQKAREGDVTGALNAFGAALTKSNPIGIALTQGQRLASTFNEGFKSGFNNNAITEIRESFEKGFKGTNFIQVDTKPNVKGNGDFDFGGGDSGNGTLRETVAVLQEIDKLTTAISVKREGGSFLNDTQESLKSLLSISSDVSPLVEVGKQLEIIENKGLVLGESFNTNAAKLELFKTTLQSLLDSGLNPSNNAITTLVDQIKALEEVEAPFKKLEDSAKLAASAFTSAASTSAKSFREIGQSALQSAAQVVKAKIVESIAAYIASSFGKLGILGPILAAGAGSVVGGLFNKVISSVNVPALASGGLATAPTLAVVGDNRNARVDPEVIAPLSKLKQFIQPQGNAGFVASTRVSGSDLEIIINRAVEQKLRTR